jgi:hypothetical protein
VDYFKLFQKEGEGKGKEVMKTYGGITGLHSENRSRDLGRRPNHSAVGCSGKEEEEETTTTMIMMMMMVVVMIMFRNCACDVKLVRFS